jgi:predicted glycosyltransferase involved in capsule biosynthesis
LIDVVYVVSNLNNSAVRRLEHSVKSFFKNSGRIIVSDTSSDEATRAKIEKLDFDDYYLEKSVGLFNRSRAINNAYRHLVKTENFIVMDIDLIAPPDFIGQIIRRFNGVYNVGNIIYLPEQVENHSYKYLSMNYRRKKYLIGKIPRLPFRGPFYKSYYSGFFIVNKKRFEDVNGFDEEYAGWGAEDEDFSSRITIRHRIKRYKMEVQCFHQWHPQTFTMDRNNEIEKEINKKRFREMSRLYEQSQALVCEKGVRQ